MIQTELQSLQVDFPSADRWLVLLLAVMFFGALFWYYARTLPPLEKRQMRTLLALRLLAFVCLFMVLAEPILALFLVSREKPVAAVLVDRSASMELGKEKREEVAEKIVRNLTALKGDWEYKIFDFADTLAEQGAFSGAKGTATAIGSALRYVSELPRLSGVVVVSDGANNSGPDPAGVAKKMPVPVYAVAVGQEEREIDLSIEGIKHPPVVYQGAPVKLEFLLSARGTGKNRLPLTIARGNKKAAEPVVDFSGDGEKTVEVELTPDSIGNLTFSAALPVLKGESQTKNNRRIFSLRVLKGKLKVLLVSGAPGWNYRFLLEALGGNSRLDVEGLVYGAGNRPLYSAALLTSRNLSDYDLFIFTEFSPALLSGAEAALDLAVREKGKGVFFCLGPELSAGNFSSKLLELLPVGFKKTAPSFFPVSGDVALTPEGNAHPATRLSSDPAQQREAWGNLPPLEGVVSSDFPTEAGTVLATVSTGMEGGRFPALAAKNTGKGKALAAAVYPIWKWHFLPAGTLSGDTTFAWFVNQACGWLGGSEEEDRFNLSTDKLVYRSGEEVVFSASAFDLGQKPLENLDVEVLPDREEKTLLFESVLGQYGGRKRIIRPGTYTAVATFKQEGKKMGEARTRFTVEELSLEDRSVSYNPTLLRGIAAASGGLFYRPEEVGRFLRDFAPQAEERSEKKEWELAHQPIFLFGMILFLGTEWYLRRRWQLL